MLRKLARGVKQSVILNKAVKRGETFSKTFSPSSDNTPSPITRNDLSVYFDAQVEGPGIWKWRHYFDVFERHISKFRDQPATLVEIGIYSGGSLPMWRHYFGPKLIIHGIDIEPACRAYETDDVHVHIGNQADRAFLRRFVEKVPDIHIIIDDGGHTPEQQSTSLEELLPALAPGGVYICEDIHHLRNQFADMVYGIAKSLNAMEGVVENFSDNERRVAMACTGVQTMIKSVTFYPYMVVIEKNDAPLIELTAPKHGTVWEPFLA